MRISAVAVGLVVALGLAGAVMAEPHPPLPRQEEARSAGGEAEVRGAGGEAVRLAALRPWPRVESDVREAAAGERRCSADGAHCIRIATYVRDVCRAIEATAREAGLDSGFFARLLWKESLFDASAVSPKGAQGIAQFMPGTAAMRGLEDPFNPAEALVASARYLAELAEGLGNIGLAAVAYNGGEARAARFIAREAGLPAETRDYVQAITGHPAEAWRDAAPARVDLALAPDQPFQEACVAQASARSVREFRTAPVAPPWGVVVASNRERAGAERQVSRLQNRHRAVLRGEAVHYTRERRPGMRSAMWYAQLGRGSRAEADALCERLRRTGGDCMVLRN